jgi:foldase protein PrsA
VALLGVFCAVPLTLSACGGDSSVPSDAVAKIGPDTITKTAFDHWMKVNAWQGQLGTARAQVPDAPDFTKCIAQTKKTSPKPAKGQPAKTDAFYKAQCQQQYTTLRDMTMQQLISGAWTEGEAADRGVTISDADLKRDFDKARVQSYPTEKAYRNFLKQLGVTQEDLLYRTKIQNLGNLMRAKVLEGTDKVTSSQIANYYNQNKSRFALPEKRDLSIVLTKTEDKAQQAKAELEAGQSWRSVAEKFSIDKTTRENGGRLAGMPKGQQIKPLDDAMFSAKKGEITGPVKTPFGYFVFQVDKITPGRQQPLSQATPAIRQQLVIQQQQTKLDAFTKDYTKKWKDRTECQKGYATQDCHNAPKLKPAVPAPAPSGNNGTSAAPATSAAPGDTTTNK